MRRRGQISTVKAMTGITHPSTGKPCMPVEAEKLMDGEMSPF
jgi:hypothetical protein